MMLLVLLEMPIWIKKWLGVTTLLMQKIGIDLPWGWVPNKTLHVKLDQTCPWTENKWIEVQTGFHLGIIKVNLGIKRKEVIMVVIQESINLHNLEVKTWWNYLVIMIYSTIKLLCNPLKTVKLVDINNNSILETTISRVVQLKT